MPRADAAAHMPLLSLSKTSKLPTAADCLCRALMRAYKSAAPPKHAGDVAAPLTRCAIRLRGVY